MRYFKTIVDGYIFSISIWNGQTEISETEYNSIMSIIQTAPTAADVYYYRLRADTLEWELVELPPEPEPSADEDIDDAEAYNIIFGGAE